MIRKLIGFLLMGLTFSSQPAFVNIDNVATLVNSRENFSTNSRVDFKKELDEYNILLFSKADMTVKNDIYSYRVYFTETVEQTEYVRRNIPFFKGTELEKTKRIYNWILNRLEYDDTLKNRNAYLGMTTGKTVCIGYAQLFYLTCLKNGVKCHIRYSKDHCWNIVYVDGKWYNVDPTWGDSSEDKNYWLLKGKKNWDVDVSHVPLDGKVYIISHNDYSMEYN